LKVVELHIINLIFLIKYPLGMFENFLEFHVK
jgi:hypothetical protein